MQGNPLIWGFQWSQSHADLCKRRTDVQRQRPQVHFSRLARFTFSRVHETGRVPVATVSLYHIASAQPLLPPCMCSLHAVYLREVTLTGQSTELEQEGAEQVGLDGQTIGRVSVSSLLLAAIVLLLW